MADQRSCEIETICGRKSCHPAKLGELGTRVSRWMSCKGSGGKGGDKVTGGRSKGGCWNGCARQVSSLSLLPFFFFLSVHSQSAAVRWKGGSLSPAAAVSVRRNHSGIRVPINHDLKSEQPVLLYTRGTVIIQILGKGSAYTACLFWKLGIRWWHFSSDETVGMYKGKIVNEIQFHLNFFSCGTFFVLYFCAAY